MKMKAIFTLVAFAAACIANATYSNMFPKIAFAKSAQAQEQTNEERVIREQNDRRTGNGQGPWEMVDCHGTEH
jgi:hypothetical protein